MGLNGNGVSSFKLLRDYISRRGELWQSRPFLSDAILSVGRVQFFQANGESPLGILIKRTIHVGYPVMYPCRILVLKKNKTKDKTLTIMTSLLVLMVTVQLPGFMTKGEGAMPFSPATVTNWGSIVGLSSTLNLRSKAAVNNGVQFYW